MSKKAVLAVMLLLTTLFPACSPVESAAETQAPPSTQPSSQIVQRSYEEFIGADLGLISGKVFDELVQEHLNANPVYYKNDTIGIEDVRHGRIAGFVTDLSSARVIALSAGNEDLEYVMVPSEHFRVPIGGISRNQNIIDQFNIFLAEITAKGTLDDMQSRWLYRIPDLEAPMPAIENTGEAGVLRVGISSTTMPFAYMGKNREIKGFSAEMALRFGAYLSKRVEFVDMDFPGLLPFIINGNNDFAIANITITAERRENVIFTNPIYYDQVGILTLRNDGVTRENTGIIGWLKTSIEKNLIAEDRWRLITEGLSVTMIISVFAQLGGTALGVLVCFMFTRKSKLVQKLADLYCNLIYAMPSVVMLLICYHIIFDNPEISGTVVAIAAFSLIKGAGTGKLFYGALCSVDPVELEAARSLGFSAFSAFRAVSLPQAIRSALPSYASGFVDTVKSTCVVGYIAISDLTRAADIIRNRTFDQYFTLLLTTLVYIIITVICVMTFKLILKGLNGGGGK